jgi:hypothetical protein
MIAALIAAETVDAAAAGAVGGAAIAVDARKGKGKART